MSRIKNLSRGGWIVVGMVVTLILVPTAAYAFTYTGIIGSSGNKADVVPGGQLLTAGNLPSDSFTSLNGGSLPNANTSDTACVAFGDFTLAASQIALITDVQVNVNTADGTDAIRVFNDSNCTGSAIVNMRVPNLGEVNIPFETPVPTYGPDGYAEGGSGDYLSVSVAASSGTPDATGNVTVNGYATA
jgi:hypothetical protein